MLTELHVRDLGIIADTTIVIGPGLTAITGETGAGKTLLVDAIALLLGGRADAGLVRTGAAEARVEGRFETTAGDEVILTRVVPRDGRSRAYVDGRLATVNELALVAAALVDLHGQHAQVRLLEPVAQRALLDASVGAPALEARAAYRAARSARREIDERMAQLGGDSKARARELDLLRFQIDEISHASIDGVDEDQRLAAEEELLDHAVAHQAALDTAHDGLAAQALDAIGTARAALANRPPFAEHEARLRSVEADVSDLVNELRLARDAVTMDPERLEAVRTRQALLRDLRRKYGDTLAEVVEYGADAVRRAEELEAHDAIVADLEARAAACDAEVEQWAVRLHELRVQAAGPLAEQVTARLAELALARASLEVVVERAELLDDGADTVEMRFAANAGEAGGPLARVASGGELSRVMLALRNAAGGDDVDTSVFDEVDAGIGGEAGVAVGRALAELAQGRQVLCVTHLPQVAAFAQQQVVVSKGTAAGRTVARAELLLDDARVDELARMLAGVATDTAREHARELLALGAGAATGAAARRASGTARRPSRPKAKGAK